MEMRGGTAKEIYSMIYSFKSSVKLMEAFQTLRLPRVQYSVRMQIFGGSVQAPMNAQILSCRKSRI